MNAKSLALQNRLIKFSVRIIKFSGSIPGSKEGNYFAGQLIRSAGSPAIHYVEVLGAESTKDFIHKQRVCLKELRETLNCLKIISMAEISRENIEYDIIEANELVSIFVSSIKTAEKNSQSVQKSS